MKKLTLLLFFTSSLIFAQDTIETKLGDFNSLKVFSGLKVELIKADVAKAVVTGFKADQVSIKNKNGTLKFSIKFIEGFKYDDVSIKLYYKNSIATLTAMNAVFPLLEVLDLSNNQLTSLEVSLNQFIILLLYF